MSFLAFSPIDAGLSEQVSIFKDGLRVPMGYLLVLYTSLIACTAVGGYVAVAVMRQPVRWAIAVLGLLMASTSPWGGTFGWPYLGSCVASISVMYLGVATRRRVQAQQGIRRTRKIKMISVTSRPDRH